MIGVAQGGSDDKFSAVMCYVQFSLVLHPFAATYSRLDVARAGAFRQGDVKESARLLRTSFW
jgi:hypothetical protein